VSPTARATGQTLPGQLGVEETLGFLRRVLPPAPVRLLEVGCGDGAVSRALAAAGYEVTGLDESIARPDGEAAAPAQDGAGEVHWVEADFLYYEADDRYDVVLFTRSLHHIAPVEAALGRAHAALSPGGLVVAEEFAFDRVNIQTARWLYDLESILIATGLLAEENPEAADAEGNPLGRWRREHAGDPPLPTGHAILATAREHFELTAVEEAPYLYRYLCDRLEPTESGASVARRILDIETRLIRERDIAAAGLRFVGRAPK
jgi:SAM-dependent methyltransferase